MKKLIKILLVLFITISYCVKPLKINAYEIIYPKLDIYVGTIDQNTNKYGGIYFGPEINDGTTITWGFDLRNKAIYSYGLSFYVDLNPGETISLSYDYMFEGIYPISTQGYSMTVMAVGSDFQFDIDLPETGVNCDNFFVMNEAVDGYIQSYCENFTYTNNTATKIDRIVFTHRFNQCNNLTQALLSVNAAYYTKKSADLIEQENNSLLGGIFENTKNLFDGIMQLPDKIATSLKGFFDNVVESINNLANTILEGIKNLFIPNDEYFSNYFDELYEFFTQKLGILMLPIDIIIDLFNGIMNINEGDGIIHIQEIKYMDVVLVQKQDYNLKNVIVEVMGNVYDIYYLFVDMILLSMVLNMARKKFDEIIGGSSS